MLIAPPEVRLPRASSICEAPVRFHTSSYSGGGQNPRGQYFAMYAATIPADIELDLADARPHRGLLHGASSMRSKSRSTTRPLCGW